MKITSNPFNSERIMISGRINYNKEVNSESLILPLEFAQKILDYSTDITAVYVDVKNGSNNEDVKNKITKTIGDDFSVKTNYEKNEIILPELPNTTEEIPEMADSIQIESTIPQDKFTNYKKRLTSEEDYHQRVEARINDLITKLENGEVKLNDLTQEDQQVIMDILNQNG